MDLLNQLGLLRDALQRIYCTERVHTSSVEVRTKSDKGESASGGRLLDLACCLKAR